MTHVTRTFLIAALAALGLAGAGPPLPVARAQTPPPAPAEGATSAFRPRLVRQGTIALTGMASYGTLLESGRYGQTFNSGIGLGFGLRYRTSYEAAVGVSFESQRFDARAPGDSAAAAVRLNLVVTSLDYYRFFSHRSRVPRYLVLGVGLVQARQTDADGELEYPGDGGMFKVGGGIEYWMSRSLTADLNVRYNGVFSNSRLDHDFQIGLGLNFYTSP
jgi:opacity protein-like surface antigen